jgi:hypothetical protein
MKRVCVAYVCTSLTYRYLPGCTSMYRDLRYLKFEFFEIRPHPRISLALERYAVAVYSRRAALVYEKLSCLVNCMYLYVLRLSKFQEILYWYVPVCTGMYWCVPVHTILPDPVQVYRIPDARSNRTAGLCDGCHVPLCAGPPVGPRAAAPLCGAAGRPVRGPSRAPCARLSCPLFAVFLRRSSCAGRLSRLSRDAHYPFRSG